MAYSLQEALDIAIEQKNNYERNLVGKKFIYAYIDKSTNEISMKEVEFQRSNYLHLTGLDYKNIQHKKRAHGYKGPTFADEFYKRLGSDSTLISDVSFIVEATPRKTKEAFRHTQDKIKNLSKLTNIAKKAEFIGDYVDPSQFDLVVNRSMESLLLRKDGAIYIPSSSQYGKAELFIKQRSLHKILAIFCQDSSRDEYKIQYLNANINIGKQLFTSDFTKKLSENAFTNPNVEFNLSALDKLKQAFTASVRRCFIDKASLLLKKRQNAFENDNTLVDYENERKSFIGSIKDKSEAEIAIDVLSEQNKTSPNDLIKEEISEISEKFGLSFPALSVPTANKPMQMSISEDNIIPTNITIQGGAVALAPTIPPNGLFNQFIDNLVKGLDNVVHKVSAAIEKINQVIHSITAPKSHSEARRASQSKSKGNSPKKKKAAENARSVVPVKRSVHEQEERTSVVGQIKELQAAQDKHTQAHQRTKSKSNDIEI